MRVAGANARTRCAQRGHRSVDSIALGGFAARRRVRSRPIVNGAVRAELRATYELDQRCRDRDRRQLRRRADRSSISGRAWAASAPAIQFAEIASSADVEAQSVDGNNDQQITLDGSVEFIARRTTRFVHTDVARGGALRRHRRLRADREGRRGATIASVEGNITAGSAGDHRPGDEQQHREDRGLRDQHRRHSRPRRHLGRGRVTSVGRHRRRRCSRTRRFSAPAGTVQVFATSANHANSQAKSAAASVLVGRERHEVHRDRRRAARSRPSPATSRPRRRRPRASPSGPAGRTRRPSTRSSPVSLGLAAGVNPASAQGHVRRVDRGEDPEQLARSTCPATSSWTPASRRTPTDDSSMARASPRAAHYQNYALANLGNFGVGAISGRRHALRGEDRRRGPRRDERRRSTSSHGITVRRTATTSRRREDASSSGRGPRRRRGDHTVRGDRR